MMGRQRGGLLARIYQDSVTPGPPPSLDVAPGVANYERIGKSERPAPRKADKESGPWLPAVAPVGVVVRADRDRIRVDGRFQHQRHGLEFGSGHESSCDIRLVGDHEHSEAKVPQAPHVSAHPLHQLKLGEPPG